MQLSQNIDGTLQVPPLSNLNLTGWYKYSVTPGQKGPAVIAGHIDSFRGPGIFYRLQEMKPGERIYIRRTNRTVAVFRVTGKHTFLKSHFPTQDVYGPTPTAQLRLITCGGTFEVATGHYLSNVIVFATLTK